MSEVTLNLFKRNYAKKKKDFKGFSQRWLAQKLNVSHTYLSHIFNGRRELPLKLVEPLCEHLDIDPETKSLIYKDIFTSKKFSSNVVSFIKSKHKATKDLSDKHWELAPRKDFELLSSWEFLAIMQITLLKGFNGKVSFIAKHFELPLNTVENMVEMLKEKGYLALEDGRLRVTKAFYEFQSQSSKEQIRNYHKSVLIKALQTLETRKAEEDIEERLITSAVMTCAKESIPRFKMKLAEFLKEFVEEAAQTDPEQVYQFSLQFFPLSEDNQKLRKSRQNIEDCK